MNLVLPIYIWPIYRLLIESVGAGVSGVYVATWLEDPGTGSAIAPISQTAGAEEEKKVLDNADPRVSLQRIAVMDRPNGIALLPPAGEDGDISSEVAKPQRELTATPKPSRGAPTAGNRA